MFVQYLGGGIGHLEQFPPANNDNGVVYEYEEDEEEMDGDDGETRGNEKDDNDNDNDGNDDDDNDDEEDDDGEVIEGDECSDPGESSDEDMGNVY